MKSKVYASFSHFLNFPDTALKFGAYYFQSNLLDTKFFFKIRKKTRGSKGLRKKENCYQRPLEFVIFSFLPDH